MTFTVTYREKSGTKAEVEIEAASRAECLAACKARGIAPLGVREGRSVAGHSLATRGVRKPFILVASVLFVLLLGCVVWWLAARDEVKPPPAPQVEKAKQPTASKPMKTKDQKIPEAVPPAKARQEPEPVQPAAEVPAPPPKKKPQSNAHLLVKDPNARVIPHREAPPRRFKYNSEEFIASLLEMEPGTPVIGEFKFSKRFQEDLRKSFDEKIEILDTDDARTRELKEAVSATKEDLRKRMEAGEDVCQILKESRKQLQELAAYKMDLMAELRNIRKSGEWTAEEYSKFVSAANKMLEGRGATPIKLPRVIVRQLRKQQEKGDSK